jgi:ferritin-like metal-binding protein YciE
LFVAESQLLKAPPHVEKYVVTGELADVLAEQTALTKTYLNSLKSALDHLGGKVSVSRNATVEAMLLELTRAAKPYPKGNLRDAALLVILQRLEHHRAAGYMEALPRWGHQVLSMEGDSASVWTICEGRSCFLLQNEVTKWKPY